MSPVQQPASGERVNVSVGITYARVEPSLYARRSVHLRSPVHLECPGEACDRRCDARTCECAPCGCEDCTARARRAAGTQSTAEQAALLDAEAWELLRTGQTYAELRRAGVLPEQTQPTETR